MEKRKNNFIKGLRISLCFLLMAGMVACGGETEVAENEVEEGVAETERTVADNVDDNSWDANEFNTTFASNNRYRGWDANQDNFLDENEYSRGFYDTWDVNNDNRLEENEWNIAVNDWGLENEKWQDWDTSGDGILDENEFRTRFARNDWYNKWDVDRDKRISEREYTDGIFGLWDENDDNMLEENEYRAYNTYYGE
ncbi:MAG: hypothetical protein LPJ89_03285 [Hymenobacteraceae bacterium]|nr:hypothetical protein [Hymenobacteraceae bacterium]